MVLQLAEIEKQARAEIQAEDHRVAVEAAKVRIREAMKRKRWWHILFPFIVKITVEKIPNGV